MKKIIRHLIAAIACIVFMTSCEPNKTSEGALTETTDPGCILRLVTLEFNGEKHEYVQYSGTYEGSLSHWAGCKYCKEEEESTCKD